MGTATIPHKAWIMVGDGERALFFVNDGDEEYPNFRVVRQMESENPATREQGSDRPGRFNDGPSVHRSAVEDTDWHQIEKDRFAREVADRLYKAAHRGQFQQIVLVAPPKVLGELRKSLHSEVTGRVIAEIDKTLTNHPVDEIESLLTG